MAQKVLISLFRKVAAKLDLMVMRPFDWRWWKMEAFGNTVIDNSQVERLTSELDYNFTNPKDQAFFEHRFTGYKVEVDGVWLDGKYGWVISGKRIHPLSFYNINDPYDGRKRYPSVIGYYASKIAGTVKRVDNVVWMPKLWNNYYHFVVELLPVLLAIKKSGAKVKVLGGEPSQYAYVHFFADLMSLSESVSFEPVKPGSYFLAKKVQLLKEPLFAKAYMEAIGTIDIEGPGYEKVFIYRKGMRSLSNNNAVLTYLSSRGFFCFDPGDHPAAFQIAALRQAEIVVGVHGAGLTNLLFSKKLTNVVELMPGNMNPNHYREIAVVKGAAYTCLKGTALDKEQVFEIGVPELQHVLDGWKA